MDSALTKPTTLILLLATFCLAGIASSVTATVDAPSPSPVSPPVDPPSPSPVNPPVDPPSSSPVSPPVDPPSPSPVSPPVDPPSSSPVSPPVDPPSPSRRPPVYPPPSPARRWSMVGVKGVVFCQSCKHAGSDNLTAAVPINGAAVKVKCNTVTEMRTTTGVLGYFFMQKSHVNTYDFDKCKAYLVSSPDENCNIPTNLHGGITGAKLKWRKHHFNPYYTIYTVEPFAFRPKCN